MPKKTKYRPTRNRALGHTRCEFTHVLDLGASHVTFGVSRVRDQTLESPGEMSVLERLRDGRRAPILPLDGRDRINPEGSNLNVPKSRLMGESPSEDTTESGSDVRESDPDSSDKPDAAESDEAVDADQTAHSDSGSGSESERDLERDDSDGSVQESQTDTAGPSDGASSLASEQTDRGDNWRDEMTRPDDNRSDRDWVWGDVEKPTRESKPNATERQLAESDAGLVSRFRTTQTGPLMWLREMLSSAIIVLAIGLLLFGISGVWPPMVAVQSGSMDPNMQKGDLIVVTDPGRFSPESADEAGVVTRTTGKESGHRSFGNAGSVVVFDEPGGGPPTIHRVHLSVEEGEDWHERADSDYLNSQSCEEIANCPAPHDGYLTKGDSNPRYDQVSNIASPVRQSWITGVARLRIPYLGWIRLVVTGAASLVPTSSSVVLLAGATSGGVTLVSARKKTD